MAILFTFWEEWLRYEHWSQTAGIPIIAVPLISYVTSGKGRNVTSLCFSLRIHKMGE